MDFLDLKDISERQMEIVNPTSAEKLLKVGRLLELEPGMRVIDFGCGYGEMLALWAEEFGISGVGIDVRENACRRARAKMAERGLAERIDIFHGDASEHAFEPGTYDAATCIGATFIWDGFGASVDAMARAVRTGCRLAIGEAYWATDRVPPDFAQSEQGIPTERHILETARGKGFDVEAVVRAGREEWDRYESDNWRELVRWIRENPDHPERRQVIAHLHESQDEYFRYGREYFGWAIYVLVPAGYREDE